MNGTEKERKAVAPYLAIGVSTVVHGIGSRADIAQNLDIDRGRASMPPWASSSHQHARQADRARRGRADRVHGRGVRRAARDRGARAVHRHPRRGDRTGWRPGAAVRDLHRGAVQGALARGHARPVLQHAVRDLARRRDRAQGREEPPVVPRAVVHAARRLRPVGRALRRRHRGVLPGPAHRRHRQPRDDLLQRRRVPRGRPRPRVQRRRGRLPAERGRPDDQRRLSGRRNVDAAEPRARALQQRLRDRAQRRSGVPPSEDAASVRHRGRSVAHRRLHGERAVVHRRPAPTRSSRRSSTSRRSVSSG